MTAVFWMIPTAMVEHRLRRYVFSQTDRPCPVNGYHNASVYIGDSPATFEHPELHLRAHLGMLPATPHDDPRWPTHCAHCDYVFTDDDQWQDFQDLIYMRAVEPHDEYLIRTHTDSPHRALAPAGAMWDSWWMPYARGDDDICLTVMLPNGRTWMVDSRASNCTLPDDTVHKCWVRHGDPRTAPGTLHVDKDGVTCSAGGGSIQAGDYHGFLHNGQLTA